MRDRRELATAYAALFNGGALLEPRAARAEGFTPVVRARLHVEPAHRTLLLAGMRGAVAYGTAARAGLATLPVYVASLASVLEPGGVLHLLCFSDRQPGSFGPRRVTQQELRDSFADGWDVSEIVATPFVTNLPELRAQAWLATIVRTA